jgi:hypothetical protein
VKGRLIKTINKKDKVKFKIIFATGTFSLQRSNKNRGKKIIKDSFTYIENIKAKIPHKYFFFRVKKNANSAKKFTTPSVCPQTAEL